MELRQNKQYKAELQLGFLESLATNEIIAGKLLEAGFVDVRVTGQGKSRTAVGRWPKNSQKVQLPAQIISVKAI